VKNYYDVVVIGGGAAGMAAAIEAKNTGAKNILIIERNDELGGILQQCIHNGFGSIVFKKDLPGPTYAQYYIEQVKKTDIKIMLNTMVMDIINIFAPNSPSPARGEGWGEEGDGRKNFELIISSSIYGYKTLKTKSIVLAMGCRERTRAQIRLPGTRPAGVFTAGTVQRMVNIEGFIPGKNFVILGSGDIGMIMARRLTLEGCHVEKVLEIMPFLTGLRRNYVQCLQDFNIPLELKTTVNRIIGDNRVQAVETIKVDEQLKPVLGTEQIIPCDTLLLSVGLIPENELSIKAGIELDPFTGGPIVDENMCTNVPGIYAAGNVINIQDLVDWVSETGVVAGKNAAFYAMKEEELSSRKIILQKGENVRSVVPQYFNQDRIKDKSVNLQIRVIQPIEKRVNVQLYEDKKVILNFKKNYARPAEMITIKVNGDKLLNGLEGNKLKVSVSEVI